MKIKLQPSLNKVVILGWIVVFFCLSHVPFLHADEINQNLNIWFEFSEWKNINPYCSENYTYQLVIHWSAPPQGNVCFYSVYKNGSRLGVTGATFYSILSFNGCFHSYSEFKSGVEALLQSYYYNSTYKIVAERNCWGLSSIADQILTKDGTSIKNASQPSPVKQNPTPTVVGEPINVASGNMFTSQTDISIPAREVPLELSRTYNSQDEFNGQFGYGWRSNFDINLKEYPDSTVVETDENGICSIYTKNPDGSYTPSAGKYSILTKNTDLTYLLVRKHGRRFYFDTQGRLIKIQERNGNAINILRNFNGMISEVDDSSGRKLLFTFDPQGRVSQVIDPAGRVFKYEYDADGNLAKTIDPFNQETLYNYNNHNLTLLTDANGHSLYFEYDSDDRVYHSWQDANNNEVSLSFDPVNSKTTVTDSRGNVSAYEYNTYGLESKITDAQNQTQNFVWDGNLNKTLSTDQNSHIATYTYDTRGNLLNSVDPQGNSTTFTYEPSFDFKKTATDAQSNVTTYDYDAKGNLLKLTDTLGHFTANTYDALGELNSSTNSKNYSTTFIYDQYGNLITTTDALGHITTFSYDILGNRTQIKDAKNNITQFTYNNLNQLIQIIYPVNSTNTFTYDALGNKISSTDSAENITTYSYDLNNKVTSIINPIGKTIAFEYDTEGNRTKVIDQNQHETTYQYDSLNRLISETNPLGLSKSYTYDPAGNRTSMTDAKGNAITYEYDSLNRLNKINYPDSSLVSFVYDSLGRRIAMTDAQGTTSYAYDKLCRLTQVDGPKENDTLQYTYDELGNRTSLMLPDGKIVQYAYDALSQISLITDSNNKSTTYTYDEVGNPININYPNNIQASYAFDALHRLTRLTNQNQLNQNKLSEFIYTYDSAGRRSRIESLDGVTDYVYDALGELTREINNSLSNQYQITYEYDASGNRIRMLKNNTEHLYPNNNANQLTQESITGSAQITITVTGTVSDANAIQSLTVNGANAAINVNNFSCQINLSAGSNPIIVTATDAAGNATTKTLNVTYAQTEQILYLYDNNGNLIKKQSSTQELNLSYDYENRLIQGLSSTGIVSEFHYGYDGEGKRILTTNGSSITNYLYDGMDVVLERNGSDDPVISYLRNPHAAGGIGGIISSQQDDTAETYYNYDGLGSVSNLSDTTGTNIQSYSYDAFGNEQGLSPQEIIPNNHEFLTKESGLSGFIYFGARYYDPSIGRFITQDPSGMVDGPNVYIYCLNNPVNYIDLFGEDTYYINNKFDTSIPTNNSISHSFIAITKRDPVSGKEKVVETFSWVSVEGGMWEDPYKKQNIEGAQKAIDTKIGVDKKGNESFDPYVEELFNGRKDQRGGFYTYRGWCKIQAERLINDARKIQALNSSKNCGR